MVTAFTPNSTGFVTAILVAIIAELGGGGYWIDRIGLFVGVVGEIIFQHRLRRHPCLLGSNCRHAPRGPHRVTVHTVRMVRTLDTVRMVRTLDTVRMVHTLHTVHALYTVSAILKAFATRTVVTLVEVGSVGLGGTVTLVWFGRRRIG